MNKKLFALALTLAVAGTVSGSALAQVRQDSDGNASPNLEDSLNVQVDDTLNGNNLSRYNNNNRYDNDTTTTTTTSTSYDNDSLDVGINESFNRIQDNDTTTTSTRTRSDVRYDNDTTTTTRNDIRYDNDVTTRTVVEDSNWEQNSAGAFSPNVNKGEIEDSDFVSQQSSGNNSPVLNKADMEDSFNSQESSGAVSPNITKGEIDDSNLAAQDSNGSMSPNMVDSKIENSDFEDVDQGAAGQFSFNLNDDAEVEDSNFVDQYTAGAVSPSMVDSEIEDSNLINGNYDDSFKSHNVFDQDGQLNAANSDVWVGNLAGDNSTVLDGDIFLGLGGFGVGSLNEDPYLGLGAASVNTGIMADSIMGTGNAQMNNAGVAINGYVGGRPGGEGVTINNNQTTNANYLLTGEGL